MSLQSRHEITGDESHTLIFLPRQAILTTAAEQAAPRAMMQENGSVFNNMYLR